MEKFLPLKEQVIVITGAESKIGLETVRQALLHGARIVLVAKTEEAIQYISDHIDRSGEVVFVKADVSLEKDVQRIADTAIRTFDGFDCWVNVGSDSIIERDVEQIENTNSKQIGDTNFWGVVFGSRSAAKFFVTSRRKGAIINVNGFVKQEDSLSRARYLASQQAVKGWSDGLRVELDKINSNVSVSLIQPGTIDSRLTISVEKQNQLYEETAAAILCCASNPKRDIFVGSNSKFMSTLRELTRVATGKFQEGANNVKRNNLNPGGEVDSKRDKRLPDLHSYYQKATRHPILSSIVLAGIGAGLWMLGKKKR